MKGSRKTRRLGCSRNRANRKQYGGAGVGYTIGAPIGGVPATINNYLQTYVPYASCDSGGARPGYLENVQIKGGLPGFSGGGKRRKNMKGGRGGVLETGSAQLGALSGAPLSGGAYTNVFDNVGGVAIMEPTYSGCGAGAYALQNPFDKTGTDDIYGVKSLITAPPALAANPTPKMGGGKRRKTRKQYGGVGGVDSMFYSAPRAGYTNWPSNAEGGASATLADGKTPFLLNVPYSGLPTPSQACLTTGGGSRKNRKSRKSRKSKKSRKNRKSNKGRK
jgi:hypothetical protein